MRLLTLLRTARDGALGLVIGAALVLTAALAAQDLMLDADGDGLISYTEAVTAYPELSEAEFRALDTDANGGLDMDEIAAAREAGQMMPKG